MNTEVGAVRAKRAFLCRPHRALSWHSIFQVTPLAISCRPYGAPEVVPGQRVGTLRCLLHCTTARRHVVTK